MFPLLLQRHCLSRAEPGAAPRDQLRDGPDALGHCSPLSCQQSWRRRSRPHQSNDVRPLARLKGTSTAGEVRKCSQARSFTRLAVSPHRGWAGALAGFGWVNQGSGKGVTGGEVLYDGTNRLGRHETSYWGTELNKLDAPLSHTPVLGIELCGAGTRCCVGQETVGYNDRKQRARYKVTTDPHAYGTNFGPS
jgi:hypothetical protein